MLKKKIDSMQSNQTTPRMQQLSFLELLEEPKFFDQEPKGEFSDENLESPFPIRLVKDFERFIHYLEKHQVFITKTKNYISRKYLPDINSQLSVQNETATSHTEQEYYPYIHFFYFLALAGRLFEKVPGKGGKMKLQETDRLSLFRELSDWEKYFFLLETFWVDVDWDDLQDEGYNRVPQSSQDLFYFFTKKKRADLSRLGNSDHFEDGVLSDRLGSWNHFLLFFEWLGFWMCETDYEAMEQPHRKNRYYAKSITLTEFGSKVIPILLMERNLQFWNVSLRWKNGEINPTPGSPLEELIFLLPEEVELHFIEQMKEGQSVQPFLQPFKKLFPEETLHSSLPRQERKFIDGLYTFKVSYMKGVWRTVGLTGKHTMDHLHHIILKAYAFDNDHLYSFFMDGKKWSQKSIVSPYDEDGNPQADKVYIGDVGFIKGQQFTYLYDYGDEWTFLITVEQITEQDSEPMRPYVIEQKGEAPDQYMDWGW